MRQKMMGLFLLSNSELTGSTVLLRDVFVKNTAQYSIDQLFFHFKNIIRV